MFAPATLGILITLSSHSNIRPALPAHRLVLKLLQELAARVEMLEQKRTGLLKNGSTQLKFQASGLSNISALYTDRSSVIRTASGKGAGGKEDADLPNLCHPSW